jgi:hypothetical protein
MFMLLLWSPSYFDGRHVTLKIGILHLWSSYFDDGRVIWWRSCYFDDRHVTLTIIMLLESSCYFDVYVTLMITMLFDDRQVTLMVMLLWRSEYYFDGRQVTWMIVMPLRFYFHSMQSWSCYWIIVQAKLDDSHHSNEIHVWFYTSLKN